MEDKKIVLKAAIYDCLAMIEFQTREKARLLNALAELIKQERTNEDQRSVVGGKDS